MGQAGSDIAIRKEAFQLLESQARIHGEVLPRPILQQGFHFKGKQIRLIGPQGIFKPRHMELPISITTVPSGPYDDEFGYLIEIYFFYILLCSHLTILCDMFI